MSVCLAVSEKHAALSSLSSLDSAQSSGSRRFHPKYSDRCMQPSICREHHISDVRMRVRRCARSVYSYHVALKPSHCTAAGRQTPESRPDGRTQRTPCICRDPSWLGRLGAGHLDLQTCLVFKRFDKRVARLRSCDRQKLRPRLSGNKI